MRRVTATGWAWRSRWSTTSWTSSGTRHELGKPVGSDLRQGTITLPVICLRDVLDSEAYRQAFAAEDGPGVVELVRSSGAIDRAHAEAESLLDEAREALLITPAGHARDALEAFTYYVVERRV